MIKIGTSVDLCNLHFTEALGKILVDKAMFSEGFPFIVF